MAGYLERYRAGEHEAVWNELSALGARVFEEPLHEDALAVARETMRRARHNVELLIRFGDWHKAGFVDYLRAVFRWGGFPGWERSPNPPRAEIEALSECLLPI